MKTINRLIPSTRDNLRAIGLGSPRVGNMPRDYLRALEREGLAREVKTPVGPYWELTKAGIDFAF